MKAKITRGKGFRGVLDYVTGKGNAERIASNISGETVREMAREFGVVRKTREDIEKPVWHCSLSLPPGETVDQYKWLRISTAYLARMGLDPENNQWIAYRHHDTDHEHVHIVVNRIDTRANVWDRKDDVYKAIRICQEMEKDFGLTQTEARPKPGKEKLSWGEFELVKKTGLNTKKNVSDTIALVIQKPCSVPEFIRKCQLFGIRAVPNISKASGKMSGFSFEAEGKVYKGSKLGWGWKNLSQKVAYTPEMCPNIELAMTGQYELERVRDKVPGAVKSKEKVQSGPRQRQGSKGVSPGNAYCHSAYTEDGEMDIANTVVYAPEFPVSKPEKQEEWQELEPDFEDDWAR